MPYSKSGPALSHTLQIKHGGGGGEACKKKKRETPDAFDREAGLRSTSCYSSAVFTSLRLVLFSYLSVSSVRRSIFLIVSRRVCAGFGRRLQTVVLFVCLLFLAPRSTPPHSPLHAASASSVKATLSQNTVKSAKCRGPGVNANQMHGPLCAICVCHFCSVPKSTVLCLSFTAAFISLRSFI